VNFHVTLHNPSPQGQVFGLSVRGVPASWVHFPGGYALDGNGSADVELTFTPNVSAELGDYAFQVTASYGFSDSNLIGAGTDGVSGTLTVAGQADVPTYLNAHGVVASLAAAEATGGQGTSAVYVARLINTGSAAETFALAAALPPGVTGAFSQDAVDVPP